MQFFEPATGAELSADLIERLAAQMGKCRDLGTDGVEFVIDTTTLSYAISVLEQLAAQMPRANYIPVPDIGSAEFDRRFS